MIFISLQRFNTRGDSDSLMIVRLTILSRLDPCSTLTSGIRCIILSGDAARVPDFLGERERGRKKRNDACPLCPLYVYYDDSGRSVDVR